MYYYYLNNTNKKILYYYEKNYFALSIWFFLFSLQRSLFVHCDFFLGLAVSAHLESFFLVCQKNKKKQMQPPRLTAITAAIAICLLAVQFVCADMCTLPTAKGDININGLKSDTYVRCLQKNNFKKWLLARGTT